MLEASCDGFEKTEMRRLRLVNLPQIHVGGHWFESGLLKQVAHSLGPRTVTKVDPRQNALMLAGHDDRCMRCRRLEKPHFFQESGQALYEALGEADIDEIPIDDLAFRGLDALSGGQRQLASLGQALVRKPEVLLMDEPTAALDLHRQIDVLEFVANMARRTGMIVLIALHDLNHALRYCTNTIVIANGEMASSGATADVITPEMLRDIYRIDARIERCSRGRPMVIVDGAL